MTKQRDRYQSGFDAGVPGIRAAVYDIDLALYCLKEIAEKHELLRERFTFHDGQSWSVAQLLEIARNALNQSMSPVAGVYERLRQNEEAARLIVEATDKEPWNHIDFALARTLNNQALISRGWVTAARKQIERRAQEANETGGDAA